MEQFCPEIWQEDPVPENVIDCEKCGLYRQGTRMIWGEGNPQAPIIVLLDNPGAREDREGNPMVCGTRHTLQKAIYEVGLNQEQMYVTYVLKRRPVKKYDKEQTRNVCMHHLNYQLLAQKPSLIICLGNVAVQSFFQNPEKDVRSLRGSFYNVRGFKTTVAYHPLAVRRRPNLYSLFIDDFQLVSSQLSNLS